MKIRSLIRKIAGIAAASAMAFASVPFGAMAMEPAATGRCSLTIEYKDGGRAIAGAQFTACLAARPDGNGFSLLESFSGSGAEISPGMSNEEWQEAAAVLAECRKAGGIKPAYSGRTDKDGRLTFSGMEEGLWLIEGEPAAAGGMRYYAQTFCTALPDRSGEGEAYNAAVSPKFESERIPNDTPPGKPSGGGPGRPQEPQSTGSLTITKEVAGKGADAAREWHFSLTVGSPLNGQYGGLRFTDGRTEFTLRHGASVTASGLPAGAEYHVRELDAGGGYTVVATGADGTITAGTTLTAKFVNTIDEVTEEALPPGPQEPDGPAPIWRTGDSSRLDLLLVIMAGSGIAFLGIVLTGRKKKDRDA